MSVALKKYETLYTGGADKKETEFAFQQIAEQIRLMEQRLIMNIQKDIDGKYQRQQNKLAEFNASLKKNLDKL
ncbi:MAG TPA: hypothetical protein VK057_01925 [Bacillota bacterium]|nr:hypothetical protein [Bacillota bacterium]